MAWPWTAGLVMLIIWEQGSIKQGVCMFPNSTILSSGELSYPQSTQEHQPKAYKCCSSTAIRMIECFGAGLVTPGWYVHIRRSGGGGGLRPDIKFGGKIWGRTCEVLLPQHTKVGRESQFLGHI